MRKLSLHERRIIELIATKGPIARTDLSTLLGVTGGTITRAITALEDLALFSERTERLGNEGPPKRLLQVRSGQYFAAGLTFSRKSIELAVLDLAGEIVGRQSVRIENISVLEVANAAAEALDKLLVENGVLSDRLVGLGCGMPVNFGPGGRTVTAHGVFQELEDPPIMQQFLSVFDMPVLLENDGKTSAIGEHVYGRHKSDGRSLYLLHTDFGVGGGAVIDGVPFYGANGNSCLTGFLHPHSGPRPSGLDLLETLVAAGYNIEDFSDLERLIGNSSEIDEWVQRAGKQLAQSVAAISGLIDPSIIVLGGRMPSEINDSLIVQIKASLNEGPSRGIEMTPLRASTLGPEGGALGAACLPLYEKFFNGQTRTHDFRFASVRI